MNATTALVFEAPHEMAWRPWPLDPLAPGEVRLEPSLVGICGSDVHGYDGSSGRRRPPMVMGHEAVGTVTAVGTAVDAGLVGLRVTLQPFAYCGACPSCQRGEGNRCEHRRFHGVDLPGAMMGALNVSAANVVPIPDAMDDACAVLVEPLAVALHAVALAGELTGRIVLVVGCGPIGLLTGFAARQAGAQAVLGTDPIESRRRAAVALGFDAVSAPDDLASLRAAACAGDRRGVEVAFEAVGAEATVAQAVAHLAPGGKLIALGGWQSVSIDMRGVVGRELVLCGSFNYRRDEFERAVTVMGEFPALGEHLVTDIVPMDGGAEAFRRLAAGTHDGLKIALEARG